MKRPKGYFIANNQVLFEKKLRKVGLEPCNLSYTEFGFPGFKSIIGLIKKHPQSEEIILSFLKKIESFSAKNNGLCHSVFVSLARKVTSQ